MRKKIKILIIVLSVLTAGSISFTFGILYYINTPSPRFGYGMVYDDSINKIVLFGGGFQDSTSYSYFGDTWIYDPIANIWTEIFPQQSPSARSSHSMVYDSINQKIILFGGIDLNDNWLDDTWIFDSTLERWTQVFPETSPPQRGSASMYFDEHAQKIILYGGYRAIGGHFEDTWSYDYATNNWTNLEPATKPTGRYGAPMVYDPINERGFLFGGRTSIITDETWIYYYTNNSWVELSIFDSPPNRYWSGLGYDTSAQTFILYGGRNTGGVGEALDDTWIFLPSSNTWMEASVESSPSNRFHFSLVYVPGEEKSILFGGFRFPDTCFSDTWSISFGALFWINLK